MSSLLLLAFDKSMYSWKYVSSKSLYNSEAVLYTLFPLSFFSFWGFSLLIVSKSLKKLVRKEYFDLRERLSSFL